MANKIDIEITGNAEKINKTFDELEKRIKSMNELGKGGGAEKLGSQYAASGQDDKAARLTKFREHAAKQNRQVLVRDLKKQEILLDRQLKVYQSMSKAQEGMVQGSDEQLKKQEKQEQLAVRMEARMTRIANLNDKMGKKGLNFADQSGGGKSGDGKASMGRALGSGLIKVAAGTMALTKLLGSMVRNEEIVEGSRAKVAGRMAEGSTKMRQGKLSEYSLYSEEYKKAEQIGTNAKNAVKGGDVMQAATGTALVGAGGAMSATGIGAAGGIPTMLAGAGTLGQMLTDDRKRNYLFGKIGDATGIDYFKKKGADYENQLGAISAEAREKSIQDQMAQRVATQQASGIFDENRGNFSSLQRQFGMGDDDLFQGENSLLKNAGRAGFRINDTSDAMRRISRAGGTTKGSKGSAVDAMEMARDMDLTNAPELLGKMSGMGMSGLESKEAIKKMYTEAVADGMDASEVRTLLESSTNLSFGTGADLGIVSSVMEDSVGLKTGAGIEATASAYKDLMSKTGQGGGKLQSQYELGGMMDLFSKEGLKYDTKTLAVVKKTEADQLSLDNPEIRGMMDRMGIDIDSTDGAKKAEELLVKMRKEKIRSTFKTDDQAKQAENYYQKRKVYEGLLKDDPEGTEEATKKAKKEYDRANYEFGGANAMAGQTAADLKKKEGEKNVASTAFVKGMAEKDTEIKTPNKSTDLADKKIREEAMGNVGSLKLLSQEAGKLGSSFDSVREKTADLAIELANLSTAVKLSKDAETANKLAILEKAKEREMFNSMGTEKSDGMSSRKLKDILNPTVDTSLYGGQSSEEDL
jgi:hypothetical protein